MKELIIVILAINALPILAAIGKFLGLVGVLAWSDM
jgi:hypothetical protein